MASISSVGGLQAEIATRLNEVSATEADTYLNWINQITQDLAISWQNSRFLEASADHTVSAGTYIYALPMTDFGAMYSVIDPLNQRKLNYVTKQEFDALSPSALNSGASSPSQNYTIYQENIYFAPIPGSSITYHYSYKKLLQDVSAASATLPFPYRFLEAYVLEGVARGLERRGDYNNATIFHKRYEDIKEKMKLELKSAELKRIKSNREFRPNVTSDPIKNAIWNA